MLGIYKLPNPDLGAIIEQTINKSPSETIKRNGKESFYAQNLNAFRLALSDDFLQETIQELDNPSNEELVGMFLYNYSHLISDLLVDAVHLMENYEASVLESNEERTVLVNRVQHDFTLYQYLRQVIYGQVSLHAFRDREPSVSVAIIRQMIELRIRNAFNLHGLIKPNSNEIRVIPLTAIFDILRSPKYRSKVDYAVPLENIERIYKWANYFVHAGIKDYAWNPIMAQRYLHQLMAGREIEGEGWSVSNGIGYEEKLLDSIYLEFLTIQHKSLLKRLFYRLLPSRQNTNQWKIMTLGNKPEARLLKSN